MSALALVRITQPSSRRRHAPREDYLAWTSEVFAGHIPSVKSRRYFHNRFVKHWPDLEAWFAEPLLLRLDLHNRVVHEPGKRIGPSHEAGPYLVYLSLVHGIALDADFVLSRNFDSMFDPRVAPRLSAWTSIFSTSTASRCASWVLPAGSGRLDLVPGAARPMARRPRHPGHRLPRHHDVRRGDPPLLRAA